MAEVSYITIHADREGQRLDNFLLFTLKGAPKSLIYRIIRKGEVRVNKGRAKPEQKLLSGDVVRIPPVRLAEKAPKPKPSEGLIRELTSRILIDRPELLIVDKPAGLAVHGGSGISLGLIESLRQLYPEYRSLELVHRLDRETSGCVIVAKKRSALRYLQQLFREEGKQEGQISKSYSVLVQGAWPQEQRVVDAPLLKNELQSGERMVKVHPDGKVSRTRFVVERYYDHATLLCATPITGRTHQIRVHAQYRGCPVVADEKYGASAFNKKMRELGFKRLFLHAARLSFRLPSGEEVIAEAPLPEDLSRPLERLSSNESCC